MDELSLFSHLGFTYTTHITVKSLSSHCQGGIFLSIFFLDSKWKVPKFNYKLEKQRLGCAIYIKEYTIMMYLVNQMHGLIRNLIH